MPKEHDERWVHVNLMRSYMLFSLLLLLVACGKQGPGPVEPTPASTGVIRGKVTLSGPSTTSRQQLGIPDDAEFVPLQALVRFRAPALGTLEVHSPLEVQHLDRATVPLQLEHHVTEDTVLVTLEPRLGIQSLQGAEQTTLELIQELRARSDVEYAEPNYLLSMQSVPNDQLYASQWHYPMIGLEKAWQVTTGSAGVVVAVLDTGILHRASRTSDTHPDFRCGRVLPGYDFVDGDPDPYDEGPFNITTYHGTHVAGTIGACTNNAAGGAGVDWTARLVNVRVLGSDGRGSLDTIARAIQWAAGVPVTGAPPNTHPAQVINLSLGGPGTTSPTLQRAIDAANAKGSIIVVAAGNDGVDARNFTPANASGVITVGAFNRQGDITDYSNYGTAIALMAPGGQLAGGEANGVLSSAGSAQAGFAYAYYQGTSMAAPHVSGVVALMKAVNPELNWQQAREILMATATPARTTRCFQRGCGAGLVNAHAAIQAAKQDTVEPEAIIRITGSTDFGSDGTSLTLTFQNIGTAGITLTLGTNDSRITLGTATFPLAAQASRSVTVSLDRHDLAPGSHTANLSVKYAGHEENVPLTYRVGPTVAPSAHAILVTLTRLHNGEGRMFDSTLAVSDAGYAFEFIELPSGHYRLAAEVEELNCYRSPVLAFELEEGETLSGVSLNLENTCK